MSGAVTPLKIDGDIAGPGLTRGGDGVLSVNITNEVHGIGKNVTSPKGSITGVANNAALVAMPLDVKVDDATIKINAVDWR